jgi:hypothetical protein
MKKDILCMCFLEDTYYIMLTNIQKPFSTWNVHMYWYVVRITNRVGEGSIQITLMPISRLQL